MQVKRVFDVSLLLLLFCFHAASANTLKIYISETVSKCVSFNLMKIDDPMKVRQLEVCPGTRGFVDFLEDGKYRLYGTEVDVAHMNPYGDREYINDPIMLSNESELAVYYPSQFTSTLLIRD